MWGTRYTWNLRVDAREAHRLLIRALETQKVMLRHAAPGTGPGPDDGAVSGKVGPTEFCLNFMPLRSRFDITASRQGGESELDPQIKLEYLEGDVPLLDNLIGSHTAVVGRIEETASGCIVRGNVRPRYALLVPTTWLVFNGCICGLWFWKGANLPGLALALAVALVVTYWITAVLSGSIRSGVGILRFLDRVWRNVRIQ